MGLIQSGGVARLPRRQTIAELQQIIEDQQAAQPQRSELEKMAAEMVSSLPLSLPLLPVPPSPPYHLSPMTYSHTYMIQCVRCALIGVLHTLLPP